MWKDNNDDILRIYTQLEKNIEFPVQCPICKKMAHIYICMFIILKQKEADYGYGVVIVFHSLTAQSMCQIIG